MSDEQKTLKKLEFTVSELLRSVDSDTDYVTVSPKLESLQIFTRAYSTAYFANERACEIIVEAAKQELCKELRKKLREIRDELNGTDLDGDDAIS